MDLVRVQEVEARYEAAQAVVKAARAALEPLAAAHAGGQRRLSEAQQALGPIEQERQYLVWQSRIEATSRGAREALSRPREIVEIPPPGVAGIPRDAAPRRTFRDDEAIRAACSKVWLDPASSIRFGLNDDFVTVGTSDPRALQELQEHVLATFPATSYRALVKQFARREVVHD